MRGLVVLAFLALSACASKPNVAMPSAPSEGVSTVAGISTVTPVQPSTENCREFTAPIKIGDEKKELVGRACEQPDGSWQIVQPANQTPTVVEHTNIYS